MKQFWKELKPIWSGNFDLKFLSGRIMEARWKPGWLWFVNVGNQASLGLCQCLPIFFQKSAMLNFFHFQSYFFSPWMSKLLFLLSKHVVFIIHNLIEWFWKKFSAAESRNVDLKYRIGELRNCLTKSGNQTHARVGIKLGAKSLPHRVKTRLKAPVEKTVLATSQTVKVICKF